MDLTTTGKRHSSEPTPEEHSKHVQYVTQDRAQDVPQSVNTGLGERPWHNQWGQESYAEPRVQYGKQQLQPKELQQVVSEDLGHGDDTGDSAEQEHKYDGHGDDAIGQEQNQDTEETDEVQEQGDIGTTERNEQVPVDTEEQKEEDDEEEDGDDVAEDEGGANIEEDYVEAGEEEGEEEEENNNAQDQIQQQQTLAEEDEEHEGEASQADIGENKQIERSVFVEEEQAREEPIEHQQTQSTGDVGMSQEEMGEESTQDEGEMDGNTSDEMIMDVEEERYVFQLSEREKTNKLFHLQFNVATNKYIRVSDGDWEIDGWQTAVYESKNMFRKEEHDWKMVYLSLQEGSSLPTGSVEWRFDFSKDTGLVADHVRIKATSETFQGGKVSWNLKCAFPGSSAPNINVPIPKEAGECPVDIPNLKGSNAFILRADLRGGCGSCYWQHAQLFRTGLYDFEDQQFEITVHFTDEMYRVEKVLRGKYFNGKLHYLVKWKGYPHSANTWEPESHLNPTLLRHLATHPVRITGKPKKK